MRDLFGRNPDKLKDLLYLREHEHMSYSALGRHFGLDHTTIMHAISRFAPILGNIKAIYIRRGRGGARKTFNTLRENPIVQPPPAPIAKYQHLLDDECVNVNQGKLYKHYRKENTLRHAAERKEIKQRLIQEFNERVKRRGPISWRSDSEQF